MTSSLLKHSLAVTLLAFSALLGGCGGGDDAPVPASPTPPAPADTTQLVVTDTVVGTGATAAAGKTVTAHYTAWLYNATAANNRGTQIETSFGGSPVQFVLGAGQVIVGWDQGLVGMKVGGTRNLVIPSAMAYGSAGRGPVPPNTALVFSIDLVAVQ
jgi:FKBP-type peptidyl-prolyl cis-trans isomerase